MAESHKQSRKLKISIAVSIILSVSIILLILYFTLDAATFQQLATVPVRYEFFVAAVCFNALFWLFWALRMKILAQAADPKLRLGYWESTKIVLANQFLAGITPSMAGGEPVRVYLLNKDGLSVGGATAVVLGERLIDAIIILVSVPLAFFIIRPYLSYYPVSFTLFGVHIEFDVIMFALFTGIAFFLLCIILLAYAIKNPEKVKRLLCRVSGWIGRRSKKKTESKLITRIGHEVDNFHDGIVYFLTKGKKSFLLATGCTVLMWCSGFMIGSMLLLGLGLPPFFAESFAAEILLTLITMIPLTPGSSGVSELSIAGFYSLLINSVPNSSFLIGVFVILFRFITYHMNVLTGAVFQYRIFKSLTSLSLDAIEKKEEKPLCK